MKSWAIITPEYPPAPGGVGDYTRQLALTLARSGDEVEVWSPKSVQAFAHDEGVTVHGLPDRFGPKTWATLGRALDAKTRRPTLLVQYTPQGFGLRVMNLPFLLWLARRPESLWLMLHEALYPFIRGQPLKHDVLAVVTRAMLGVIGSRADRVFVSVPAWQPYLERYARLRCKPEWLPVPSNLPTTSSTSRNALRARYGISPTAELLVHFGSYSGVVVAPLRAAAPTLLNGKPDRLLLLLGRNSRAFRQELLRAHPELGRQLIAVGGLPAQEVADALCCADLAVFPFPDGVSGRRGSLMAALALGVAVLGTEGASTETFWRRRAAVALVETWNTEALAHMANKLLADDAGRASLGQRGREAYARYFAIERTAEVLLEPRSGSRALQ